MHTAPNGVLNDTVGGVISLPQCSLTRHLVWYAHFIFNNVSCGISPISGNVYRHVHANLVIAQIFYCNTKHIAK